LRRTIASGCAEQSEGFPTRLSFRLLARAAAAFRATTTALGLGKATMYTGTGAQPKGGDLRLGHRENGTFKYGTPAMDTRAQFYTNTDRALGSSTNKAKPPDLSFQTPFGKKWNRV
jgi:hypothetical protein